MRKFLLLFILLPFFGFSQVGINTANPDPSAILHVESTDKGVILPRLTKSQISAIPNPATGLMVFNAQDNCLNYYNSVKWVSMCGDNQPAAVLNIGSAIVNGGYREGRPLTGSETITLPIDVTSEGSINITITTGNGYSYSYSANNISQGHYELLIPGLGTPANYGTDNATISINGVEQAYKPTINVAQNIDPKKFTVNCETAEPKGRYVVNRSIDGTNYINVSLTNNDASEITPFSVYTNSIDGISFSATGILSPGETRTVQLLASGMPTVKGMKTFTISSNSTDTPGATCSVNVNVEEVFRRVKVLGLGGGMYQPGTASATEAARAILQATANFGPNGTVLTGGIDIVNGGTENTSLANLISSNNIDVVIIGYNYQPSESSIAALDDFIKNKKGVVIASQENGATSAQNLVNTITGGTVATTTLGQTSVNPIESISDPLLEGPFGDVKGKMLGADVNNSYYFTGLPANVTSLVTQNNNATRSFAFKHNALGFVMLGDSGWIAGTPGNTDLTTWPAKHTSGIPQTKAYTGGNTVYNSIFYANSIAWAIDYLRVNKP